MKKSQVAARIANGVAIAMVSLAGGLSSAADASDGATLYYNHCAACHGAEGEGGGPVASLINVQVPNLRNLAERSGGEFPADTVAAYIDGREIETAHGTRTMPIWGDVFSASTDNGEEEVRARIAALVEFIARIQYR